jgi:chromosome partitioning protein
MRILAVVNQKGGVGKTTTTVNLGAALAMRGRRSLVVDLDPQSNLTTSLGLQIADDGYSIYDVLVDREPLARAVLDTGIPNLIACPSDPSLAAADLQIAADDPDPHRRALRLRESFSDFVRAAPAPEFALLDCPPSLGLLTVNALAAAEAVVVPMQCEFFAMQGLSRLMDTVARVGRAWNPGLGLLGVLFTMVDRRTNLAREVIAEVRSKLGGSVFQSIVPRSVRAAEAPSFGEPLVTFDPRSKAAVAYSELAEEVLAR